MHIVKEEHEIYFIPKYCDLNWGRKLVEDILKFLYKILLYLFQLLVSD